MRLFNNVITKSIFFFFNFVLFFASWKMSLNPLWLFFYCGEKQNTSHYKAYCKGCVKYYMSTAKLWDQSDNSALDAAACLVKEKNQFNTGAYKITIICIC